MAEALQSSLALLLPALNFPSGWSPSPLSYGAYFDLLVGSTHGFQDRSAEAEAWLCTDLASVPRAAGNPEHPVVSTLSGAHYTEAEIARFIRWWDIEPDNVMSLRGLDEASLPAASIEVRRALDALRAADAELADETGQLIRQVVLAQPDGSQLLDFGGASSFALWGAVAINARVHRDWRDYLKTLVHESAHLLLFAIAREEPLVENDPGERYSSPLRADRRPMDGIFHAAFVSARESLAIDACLARLDERPDVFDHGSREVFEAALRSSVLAFEDCVRAIARDGRLTALGRSVLEGTTEYMRKSFSIVPASA